MTRGCATSLEKALAVAAAAAALAGCGGAPSPEALLAEGREQWPFVERYCAECHNGADFAGEVSFDGLGPEHVAAHAETFERAVRKLRGGLMPPPGGAKPERAQAMRFVAWLEASLDAAAPAPEPGYVTPHRMNRTEYANAIRDLLALDVDPATLLPVDGVEHGFDNIANALTVSPSFIDQFLSAARNLSAQAVGNPQARAVGTPYTVANARAQQFHVPGLPLGTRGGTVVEHYFPVDGEYRLNIGDLVTGLWGFNQEHKATVIALLDGRKFFELDIGGGQDLKELDQIGAPAVDAINARLKDIPFAATAGAHRLGVTFLHRSYAESDRHLHAQIPGGGQDTVLTLSQLEIFGPVQATGLSSTPSRDKIFVCRPEAPAGEKPCAEHIVATLAREAFRGAFVAADLPRLMRLYDEGAAIGGFEKGVEHALAGVLAHPKFLYRFEPKPEGAGPGEAYPLSSVELASRLSFFLWSSIPDAELLELAADDRLADPKVLKQQVERMLADPRAEALATSFAYQWLGLGELAGLAPDPAVFGDVDRDIRAHFVTEAQLFVDSVFRSDSSVLELLTAKHTFVNEALARHYGIEHVRGPRFRRVELADANRFGLLGKGGVLLASSYPNRTSPVLRGQWLLENVLGTPPAAPPPNVEALVETVEGQQASTVRARLEAHRTNPSCNACHGVIDPLGFALENFDAVGRWRVLDREARAPIDASGVLVDGTPVSGPVELRAALLKEPEQFVQTLTEKLMTYGLGRSLTHTDMPTVRRIVRETAERDYRFSDLVWGIVESTQFRMKGGA
jgi:mono/diheme cytochrome c family protein